MSPSRPHPQPVHPTRKHLALVKKERRARRALLIVAGIVFTAVVVLVGLGISNELASPGRAAVTVNGAAISREELLARTTLARSELFQQREQAVEMMSVFAGSPEIRQSLQQQIAQIDQKINDTSALAAETIEVLIQARLIRQEAERRGITVTEDDVDQAIADAFGFFPNGTPTPRPSPTIDATVAAQQTPTATGAAPTPTTRSVTPTAKPTATSGPTPTASAVPSPAPTATTYTRELFEADYRAYVEGASTSLDVSEKYLRDQFVDILYRQRLLEAFQEEAPTEDEQVWAKHILVQDRAVALALLSRLRQGEAWDALAAQYSEDLSNKDLGGDLGWFGRGAMLDEFEQAAFEGAIGEIVGPIQTQFGWHLIQILDRGVRKLDAASRSAAGERAFQEWLASALEQASLTFDEELFPPTVTSLPAPTISVTP